MQFGKVKSIDMHSSRKFQDQFYAEMVIFVDQLCHDLAGRGLLDDIVEIDHVCYRVSDFSAYENLNAYKSLREKFPEISYPSVLSDLKQLTAIQLSVHKKPLTLRTELKLGSKQAFKGIGMKPPNRILAGDVPTHIV